jgi:hypothetical protein
MLGSAVAEANERKRASICASCWGAGVRARIGQCPGGLANLVQEVVAFGVFGSGVKRTEHFDVSVPGVGMTKVLRAIAIAASALACLAGGTIWQLAFRTPAVDPLPLPSHLVPLTAAEGQRLLAQALRADYQPLSASFESQQRPAFCGVASSVAVLNALRPPERHLTQATFFTEWTSALRVTFTGMTLHELGELLRMQGVQADIVHAGDTTLDTFHRVARENLERGGDYVLVNYQRASLGQQGGGHISPLAAYSALDDRFLVLDVAAYRYPPVWVPAADLWRAMNTVDSTSGRTRGFVIVRSRRRRREATAAVSPMARVRQRCDRVGADAGREAAVARFRSGRALRSRPRPRLRAGRAEW